MDKLKVAKSMQVLFWINGICFLASIWFSLSIVISAIFLALQIIVIIVIFNLKCNKCGVNLFYPAKNAQRYISGIDMLAPVRETCAKCGSAR